MSIDHRAEAEKHLATASRYLFKNPADTQVAQIAAAIGQGHATLARDEEQATTMADLRDALALHRRRNNAVRELVAAHIAKGLASREKNRWEAARSLAQALDEAEANVDDLIDARLSDDGYDTKTPWTFPSPVRRDDPWAATPDITADVPEPIRLVLADRLARALLNEGGDGQSVARTLAFALKNEGADLTGDIEKRITDLTLGADPSDPPF
jgi:hypothetical protein